MVVNECTRYRGLYRVGVVDTPIDDDPTDSVDPVPVSDRSVDAVAMSDPPRVLGRLRCALGLARSAWLISGAGCGVTGRVLDGSAHADR